MPVNPVIWPARARAYRPLTSRPSQTSSGVDRCTSTNRPCRSTSARASSRAASYGAIAATTTVPPCLTTSPATKPIRRMLRSRSSREKESSLDRWVRTTSPSSTVTGRPSPSRSATSASAIVDLPAPESPVRNTVTPGCDSAGMPPVSPSASRPRRPAPGWQAAPVTGRWRTAPRAVRAAAVATVLVLAYGTVVHVVQLAAAGGDPYPDLPGWLRGYFVSLTLLDPLAALLLARRRRSGVVLAVAVLVSDAVANGWANHALDPAEGLTAGRVGHGVITLVAVGLLVATPGLWRATSPAYR